MARTSSVVERLSEEHRAELDKKIASGKATLNDLLDWLEEHGYIISHSALGRYSKSVRAVGEKIRQSREMTEALVHEIGPAAADGQQGRLLVEALRSLVFDFQMKLIESDAVLDPESFMQLARALKDMSSAARLDQDFELKIRERVEKETKEAAAKAVDEAAKETDTGLSAETVTAIKAKILGIKVEA